MSEDDEARRRVRRLLLSGDNTLKNRHDAGARDRARARFEEALAVGAAAGLDESVLGIVRARLRLLEGADAA
ncbi:hypothetical protein [Miltoncostaea marina]|uniref:hypothetical protein n=1 Tax=Miltoncostaea marina TaxID=2843215 RepID=UPI001C3E2919|nr:hypothetical protein [Miltoncostaea marina]